MASHDKRFKSLRVSLTNACNYACVYCVDSKRDVSVSTQKTVLTAGQMSRLVGCIVEGTGIESVRLTGGEPLVAPIFDEVLRELSKLPAIRELTLTTNAHLLKKKLEALVRSGMKRINISMDALDQEIFSEVTRGGDVRVVRSAIDAALAHGMQVKVNMVPMRSVNEGEIVPMLKYCLTRGIELRFIEIMRMGHLFSKDEKFKGHFIGMADILDKINKAFEFEALGIQAGSTANRFYVPQYKGYFGVIANSSAPFCNHCSRLRLAVNGDLYGCLSNSKHISLLSLLDMTIEEQRCFWKECLPQIWKHKGVKFTGDSMVMQWIGG